MSVAEHLRCPTTGQECGYRVHLDQLYTTSTLDHIPVPSEFNQVTDGIKLAARLFEHGAAARVTGCKGPNEDFSCPTAETMANNRPRTASKTVVKKVISLFRGTK